MQIFHVESLSSWTRADLETACRQLGYQGGQWWSWIDRQWPSKPRLLYEEPGCRGIEISLKNCDRWSERQLGAGVCGELLDNEAVTLFIIFFALVGIVHYFM